MVSLGIAIEYSSNASVAVGGELVANQRRDLGVDTLDRRKQVLLQSVYRTVRVSGRAWGENGVALSASDIDLGLIG